MHQKLLCHAVVIVRPGHYSSYIDIRHILISITVLKVLVCHSMPCGYVDYLRKTCASDSRNTRDNWVNELTHKNNANRDQ